MADGEIPNGIYDFKFQFKITVDFTHSTPDNTFNFKIVIKLCQIFYVQTTHKFNKLNPTNFHVCLDYIVSIHQYLRIMTKKLMKAYKEHKTENLTKQKI